MKALTTLIALALGGYGVWVITNHHPQVKSHVEQILDMGHFHTLEMRYSANQIMEQHKRTLLKDSRHRYLDPVLEFYPYLLMEVKYTTAKDATREGVVLWDLTDGEMVIDTKDWRKTHGLGDCIEANTTPQEFRILHLLARKGGSADREMLMTALHVEHEILDGWIDSCRKKKLIVQSGNHYRLHFDKPHLRIKPETHVEERLVTKPFKNAVRLPRRFSLSQIEKVTQAAFGSDFAIRKTTDIYLPVHSILIQNPDGSVHSSRWNGLSGQPLSSAL